MIKQAKGLARINNFKAGTEMYQDAEELKEKEVQSRQDAVQKRYSKLKVQIYEQQKNELIILNQNLLENLKMIEYMKQSQIQDIEDQFKVAVLHRQNSVIKKHTKTMKDREKKLQMFDTIVYFTAQVLSELTGQDIRASPRGMGNKSPFASRSQTPKSSRTTSRNLSRNSPMKSFD